MDVIKRTLHIVCQLAEGKFLRLPDEKRAIAMGDDMSIGYIFTRTNGDQVIPELSTIDLKQLNKILNDNNISYII